MSFRWLIAKHFGAECAYPDRALASIAHHILTIQSARDLAGSGRMTGEETSDAG